MPAGVESEKIRRHWAYNPPQSRIIGTASGEALTLRISTPDRPWPHSQQDTTDGRTKEVDSTPSKHYVDYDEYGRFSDREGAGAHKATEIFTTLTTVVAAFVGYLFPVRGLRSVDLRRGIPATGPRTALLVVVVLALGAILVRQVRAAARPPSPSLYAARMLETADPNLQSNLLELRGCSRIARGGPRSPGVLRSMEKRAAVELSQYRRRRSDRPAAPACAWLMPCWGSWSSPRCMSSFRRRIPSRRSGGPWLRRAAIDVATRTMIGEITPGDDSVSRPLVADRRGRCARPRR